MNLSRIEKITTVIFLNGNNETLVEVNKDLEHANSTNFLQASSFKNIREAKLG